MTGAPTTGVVTFTRFGFFERVGEFQMDGQHGVRIGLLRERNEVRVAVLHGHDGRAVDGRGPSSVPAGSVTPEVRVAAVLHEVLRVGQHLAFLGNPRR